MIKYHGTPFGGSNQEAAEALIGKHAFVSFAAPNQLEIAMSVCQSVAFDNGAFSAWRSGKVINWDDYFRWVECYVGHPRFDWAIIPDVIDGGEEANLELIRRWHVWFGKDDCYGVPVWHMHESADKLKALVSAYRRIAIGSSAEYAKVGSASWHARMQWAMQYICGSNGYPKTKVHMLRGLNPAVFCKYPFASADSTNAGRNCNMDTRWTGVYAAPSPSWRARVIMARTESFNSTEKFELEEKTTDLFGE